MNTPLSQGVHNSESLLYIYIYIYIYFFFFFFLIGSLNREHSDMHTQFLCYLLDEGPE